MQDLDRGWDCLVGPAQLGRMRIPNLIVDRACLALLCPLSHDSLSALICLVSSKNIPRSSVTFEGHPYGLFFSLLCQ